MKISKRLRTISSFVPDGSFVLDVGCDHAYLGIYLTKYKKARVIASDINPLPLKIAEANVLKYQAKNITLKMQDGISEVPKEVDTIVISGMGSKTIVDILTKDKRNLEFVKTLILGSNNDYAYLREQVNKLGFKIKNEAVVEEDSKFYEIIVYQKGQEKLSAQEIKYGPCLMQEKSAVFLKYQKEAIAKLLTILEGLPKTNKKRCQEIEQELCERQKLL